MGSCSPGCLTPVAPEEVSFQVVCEEMGEGVRVGVCVGGGEEGGEGVMLSSNSMISMLIIQLTFLSPPSLSFPDGF